MHLILQCDVWLNNVKYLQQYILQNTVWNSLASLILLDDVQLYVAGKAPL